MLRLRIDRLAGRLATMPLLKLLIPFAVGIALAERWMMPWWMLLLVLATTGTAAILFRRSAYLLLAFVAAGWLNAALREDAVAVPYDLPTGYAVRVTTNPLPTARRFRSEGVLEAWRDPATGRWQAAEGRLNLIADSSVVLYAGDRILYEGRIVPFRTDPEAYRRLMIRRGFAGSCFLSERSVVLREAEDKPSLHTRAARRMARLLPPTVDRTDRAASAVVRAMTVGDRSGIDRQLRTDYSYSGMSHLLSVSGLHTGIVFALLNLLLWWIPLLRRGQLLRGLLVVVAVWLFVAAAGFPPSAIRAAVMCSVLQCALFSSSVYSAMNAWSAAALVMLVWNPSWIGDVGFQLSFVAVAAILVWGVPLGRWCRVRWRLPNAALQTVVVGLVASVATAPLISHYFGIVPLLGVWFNPVVILLGTLLVAGGVLILVCPFKLPLLGEAVLMLGKWQNRLAAWITRQEGSVAEVSLTRGEVMAIYLLLIVLTLVGGCIEKRKDKLLPDVE